MGKRTGYQPGEFCWIDVMTPDRRAAARFYADLFGWDIALMEEENGQPYTIFRGRADDGTAPNLVGMGDLPQEMQQAGVPSV